MVNLLFIELRLVPWINQSLIQFVNTSGARARLTMLCAALLLACAITATQTTNEILNNTHIDKQIIQRLATLLDSNRTLTSREFTLLNRTAANFGIDQQIVNQLTNYVKENATAKPVAVNTASYAYDEAKDETEPKPVEESPDYASSVVLASDLLSLTSAVANVKEKVCREQGYKFLDGLLLNKRWALRSEYNLFINQNLDRL